MPLPPDGQVAEFDRGVFQDVLRAAMFAADGEALRFPAPRSRIRNPDGSLQNETGHEHTARIVRTVLLHLLEQNLVVFPPDIKETLDGWIPAERVGKD